MTDIEGASTLVATYHARVHEAKRAIVTEALVAANGDRADAAKALGLSRATVYGLIRSLVIVAPTAPTKRVVAPRCEASTRNGPCVRRAGHTDGRHFSGQPSAPVFARRRMRSEG